MISVILCAAGSGSRAGFPENKVLRELNGLPVLSYSLSAFGEADEILIPCREEDEARIGALLSPFPQARTVRGGETREESVWNALQEVRGDIVLIHDAARPFVTRETVRACIQSVQKYGSGVCSLPATDTTVLARDGAVAAVPPRGMVFTVQTPQGFLSGELKHAFALAEREGKLASFTDESSLYAAYIAPPHLFEGDRRNKKLTYPEDFAPCERAGFGIDTHAFGRRRTTSCWRASGSPQRAGLLRTATATCSSTP